MINCSTCTKFDGQKCEYFGRLSSMLICPYAEERRPRTNGDKIRAMTDEELAELLAVFPSCRMCVAYLDGCDGREGNCEESLSAWLKQEVEE